MQMAIPENQKFTSLLLSLSIKEPADKKDLKSIEIPSTAEQNYTLWYKESSDLKIHSLIKKIQDELLRNKHASNEEIAIIILGVYCLFLRTEENAVPILNKIINEIVEGQVKQIYVIPLDLPIGFELNLDKFKIGKINNEKISYRCSKIRSKDYKSHEEQLFNKYAIERDDFYTKVIEWKSATIKHKYIDVKMLSFLIFEYFAYMAEYLFKEFWILLKEEQQLIFALGSCHLGDSYLQKLNNSMEISIFMNIGKSKWGTSNFSTQIKSTSFDVHDKTVHEVKKKIDFYQLNKNKNKELYNMLMNYTKFVASAKQNISDGNLNDGFIHFFIALELLLGQRNLNASAFINRASALTHLSFKRSFQEQVKIIEALYNKRSRYVHEGVQILESDSEMLWSICEEVLLCLLRMFKRDLENQFTFIDKWHIDIDYYISAMRADKEIAKEEIESIGIQLESIDKS